VFGEVLGEEFEQHLIHFRPFVYRAFEKFVGGVGIKNTYNFSKLEIYLPVKGH